MIGDSVVIKILSIQEGQVKIGIEAPKEVRILRGKSWFDEIHQSNEQASKGLKNPPSKRKEIAFSRGTTWSIQRSEIQRQRNVLQ